MKNTLAFILSALLLAAGCVRQKAPIGGMADLDRPGMRIGVPNGAAACVWATAHVTNATIVNFATLPNGYTAVDAGKVDAFLFDRAGMVKLARRRPTLAVLPESVAPERIVIGIRKADPHGLRDKVNAFIDAYRADGTYADMYRRWILGDGDETVPALPPPASPAFHLRIGMEALNDPFEFKKEGRIVGFDVEFVSRFAQVLGATYELVDMRFDALMPALECGKIDLIVSNMNQTDERNEKLDFSKSYIDTDIAILVLRDRVAPEVLLDASALATPGGKEEPGPPLASLAGKKVSCIEGGVFDKAVLKNVPTAQIVYHKALADQVLALDAGRVDALTADLPVWHILRAEHSEFRQCAEQMSVDHYGMIVDPKRPELRDELNAFLAKMKGNGKLKRLQEKWLDGPESGKQMAPPSATGPKGVLRVSVEGGHAPFEYVSEGRLVGYEVELVCQFAAQEGYGVDLETTPFRAIIASVATGKSAIGIGTISITAERAKAVNFTDPDYDGGTVAIVKAGSGAKKEGTFAALAASFRRTFIAEARWRMVLRGLGVTLTITVSAILLGTLLGALGCCLLRSGKVVSGVTGAAARVMLGTPMVVFLMVMYYVVFGKIDVPGALVAILAFALNFAASTSVLFKGVLDAVDSGQIEAARAMGFTRLAVYRFIAVPQAVCRALPDYTTLAVGLLKDTAIVGYIAIEDLTKVSDIITSRTYEAFFPLVSTAIIYLAVAYLMVALLDAAARRLDPMRRPRTIE